MPRKLLKLGQFAPDIDDINSRELRSVINGNATNDGYRPIKGTTKIAELPNDETIREASGHFFAETVKTIITTDDNVYEWAGGTASAEVGSAGFEPIGEENGYSTANFGDSHLKVVVLGNKLILGGATNLKLQSKELSSVTRFQTIDNAPAAKYMAVTNDFLILGNYTEGSETFQSGLRWSEINNPEGWRKGTNFSGEQNVLGLGELRGLIGGTLYSLVFFANGIGRLQFTGGEDFPFQFEIIDRERGLRIPDSLIQFGEGAFYYSEEGFVYYTEGNLKYIGAGRVDDYFRRVYLDDDSLRVGHDKGNSTIIWSYNSNTQDGGREQLRYNYKFDKFSISRLGVEGLGTANSASISVEDLTEPAESYTIPFDDDFYKGESEQFLVGFTGKELFNFSGANLPLTIETNPQKDARNIFLTEVIPTIATTDGVTVQIKHAQNLSGPFIETPNVELTEDGIAWFQDDLRYYAFVIKYAVDAELTSIEYSFEKSGER